MLNSEMVHFGAVVHILKINAPTYPMLKIEPLVSVIV